MVWFILVCFSFFKLKLELNSEESAAKAQTNDFQLTAARDSITLARPEPVALWTLPSSLTFFDVRRLKTLKPTSIE